MSCLEWLLPVQVDQHQQLYCVFIGDIYPYGTSYTLQQTKDITNTKTRLVLAVPAGAVWHGWSSIGGEVFHSRWPHLEPRTWSRWRPMRWPQKLALQTLAARSGFVGVCLSSEHWTGTEPASNQHRTYIEATWTAIIVSNNTLLAADNRWIDR